MVEACLAPWGGNRSRPIASLIGIVIALLAVWVSVQPAHTDEPLEDEQRKGARAAPAACFDLGSTVVTGTRTEKCLKEAPVQTDLITAEEIRELDARNVGEALNLLPGVYVDSTPLGSGVWIQGIDPKRVLILIDGERVIGTNDGVVDLDQLDTVGVERIEVIKGASSALYGTDAIGGVVNIITQKPQAPPSVSALGEYGRFNQARIQGGAQGKYKSLGASTYVGYRRSDGFDLNPDTPGTDGDRFENLTAGGLVSLDIASPVAAYIGGRFFRQQRANLRSTLYPGTDEWSIEEVRDLETRYSLRAGLDVDLGSTDELTVRFYYQEFQGRPEFDTLGSPTLTAKEAANRLFDAQAVARFFLFDKHLLVAGVESMTETLQVDTFKSDTTGTITRIEEVPGEQNTNVDLYVQDEWMVHPTFSLIAGVRGQWNETYGVHVLPSGSLFYRPVDGVNLRASCGMGFRAPSLKERFYLLDHSSLGYIVEGNPDLDPEKSLSVNAGVEFFHPARWQRKVGWLQGAVFRLGGFYNRLTDLIATELTEGELLEFRYSNIDSAYTAGCETSVDLLFLDYFSVYGSYTFLVAENLDTGERLPMRPTHNVKWQARFDYPWRLVDTQWNVNAVFFGSWQSSMIATFFGSGEIAGETPAYMNLKTRLALGFLDYFEIYGGVRNLTNDVPDTENPADLTPPWPREYFVGLDVRFEWD